MTDLRVRNVSDLDGVAWSGAVYIGRGGRRSGGFLPSEWGNPFPIKDGQTREQAIELFRGYAVRRLAMQPTWLEPLRGKVLVCHCAPLACHGDVLIDLLDRGEVIEGRYVFVKEAP